MSEDLVPYLVKTLAIGTMVHYVAESGAEPYAALIVSKGTEFGTVNLLVFSPSNIGMNFVADSHFSGDDEKGTWHLKD